MFPEKRMSYNSAKKGFLWLEFVRLYLHNKYIVFFKKAENPTFVNKRLLMGTRGGGNVGLNNFSNCVSIITSNAKSFLSFLDFDVLSN